MFNRDDLERLDHISLEPLRPYIRDDEYFYRRAGYEHYRLLAHLSTLFHRRTIFDIGTHRGDSAIALSLNDSNHVESFDIIDAVPSVRRMRENISFNKENLFDPSVREKWAPQLLESPLIFLDIDPHEGTREYEFVKWLEARHYQGLIVLDDIWYFEGMRKNLWQRIEPKFKVDATSIGHWSGTGFVAFNANALPELPKRPATRNWTVVTGYFDLTNREDANPDIKARPPEHYIDKHASGLLSQDQSILVFTEPAFADKIWKLRPKCLHDKTRVVVMEFDEFPLSKWIPEVIRTRGSPHCARHPRMTASYYLFCVARFAMLKRAVVENPFESSHFAWTNICIERMGWKNLEALPGALATNRDKFSTCYIDYIPKSAFASLPNFFGRDGCRDPNPYAPCGRCSLCSGFFTANAKYATLVSTLVEEKFLACLREGYGHADEQLLALVHHDHPELFDWYPGDYSEMITNYRHVQEHPEAPIHNLIRHSAEDGAWAVCKQASDMVWQAYTDGHANINDGCLAMLLAARKLAEERLTV